VEIQGGSVWMIILVSCVSMGPYGALHAPKTRLLVSSGTYSYSMCAPSSDTSQGEVWSLNTELLPCCVFDLKSKIVFSRSQSGLCQVRLLSGSLSENLQRGPNWSSPRLLKHIYGSTNFLYL
jgi:hypothetical protein